MTTGAGVRPADPQASESTTHNARWVVVAEQECRDLWLGGRGPLLLFAFSLLLSVVTYLAATNQVLNFLERREAANLALQMAVAVGALLTLVVSADGISGERERGTLESLLLTPVSRPAIVLGKLAAALSLWAACFVVLLPYLWVLGRGLSIVATAIGLGLLVGTLLAVGLSAPGLLISALSNSNRVSLAGSLFLLLALFVPTQLPTGPSHGWFFEVLLRVNPIASSLHYLSEALVAGHPWTQDLSYVIAPMVLAVLAVGILVARASTLVRLQGGVGGA